jgi:hypothetical protein
MNRFLCFAAAALGLFAAPAAQAQSTYDSKTVYSAVDDVTLIDGQLTITGVVQGQSGPSTQDYFARFDGCDDAIWIARQQNCLRLATLAMAKPGAFLFSIGYTDGFPILICSLSRAVP